MYRLLNTGPAVSLNATFAPLWPPTGNIGMLSQSGALGLAILDYVTLEELFDVAALLATQPIPHGPGVGVVTNAGGPGILLTDAREAHGFTVPELTPETQTVLRAVLPAQAGLSNPVDMIASATPEQYTRTIEIVGTDPGIDAVVIYIPPLVTTPEEIAPAIAQGAGRMPAHKPVLSVFLSSRDAPPALSAGPRGQLPSYRFPENAAQALAAAVHYGRWRARPRGIPVTLSPFAHSAVRAVIDRVLEGAVEPLWVQAADLVTVLRVVEIECAVGEQTTSHEASSTAERLGYPLVAKALSPDVPYKSDVGGVLLGLDSVAAVTAAVGTLVERFEKLGARLDGILLQHEIPGGLEALVGVTTEATFGPLVVCGLGGTLVEILHDVAFRLPPVTDLDAAEMLARLRATRLLDGYRGAPPADRAALVLHFGNNEQVARDVI